MRKTSNQHLLGTTPIEKIFLDENSRDDTVKILRGLQHIYSNKKLLAEIEGILETVIANNISKEIGRPGMSLWNILVLSTLKNGLRIDYDRLLDTANNHIATRQMLGIGEIDRNSIFKYATVHSNINLVSEEILNKINVAIVKHSRDLISPRSKEIHARCDSLVVETNVHYPTDGNLLFDAMRCIIRDISRLCKNNNLDGWRQSEYNIKNLKRMLRQMSKIKRSTSKCEKKKEERVILVKEKCEEYIQESHNFLDKAKSSISLILEVDSSFATVSTISLIEKNIEHALRQMDQLKRRVIKEETIKHDEKKFSIFEEHTEWICKGKAGVPFELGLKVCVVNDENGFVLNHKVCKKESDSEIMLQMYNNTKENFDNITGFSVDKGFWSVANKKELSSKIPNLVMPKKGKLSKKDKEEQNKKEFISARKKHSAVESDINSLEHHGLDKCRSKGEEGFRKYVSLSILSYNINKLGAFLQEKELKKVQKERKKAKLKLQQAIAA